MPVLTAGKQEQLPTSMTAPGLYTQPAPKIRRHLADMAAVPESLWVMLGAVLVANLIGLQVMRGPYNIHSECYITIQPVLEVGLRAHATPH